MSHSLSFFRSSSALAGGLIESNPLSFGKGVIHASEHDQPTNKIAREGVGKSLRVRPHYFAKHRQFNHVIVFATP
ncbi:hypothetical protein D3C85_1326440 [compost metagenome]